VFIDYKRALKMSEYFVVKTGIESIDEKKCRVHFEIVSKATNKTCCDGWFDFVMISMETGKGILIPQDVIAHYVQPVC